MREAGLNSTGLDRRKVWATADLHRWRSAVGADTGGAGSCLRELWSAGLDQIIWTVRDRDDDGDLETALAFARRHQMTLVACIPACVSASRLADHPDWRYVGRDGHGNRERSSLFVEAVRDDRIETAMHVVQLGADGLMVDFCDRPPHIGYHPGLIHEYVVTGGPAPLRLPLTDETFLDWCSYRAHFVTRTLQGIRSRLAPLERERSAVVPLIVRVPDDGLQLNLLAGLHVRNWVRSRTMDAIGVAPLRWLASEGATGIDPYVKVAAETGVPVLGGVALIPPEQVECNPMAALARVRMLYERGAVGLVVEGAESGVLNADLRWILPALAEPERVARLLEDEGRRRQYPLKDGSRWFGVSIESSLPCNRREAFSPAEL